jgi:hypothetical protein
VQEDSDDDGENLEDLDEDVTLTNNQKHALVE